MKFFSGLELTEKQQILFLLIVVGSIGMAGLYLTGGISGKNDECGYGGCGDIYVDSYSGDLYLNGTFKENFIYGIKKSGKYKMLHRNWELPVSVPTVKDKTSSTISEYSLGDVYVDNYRADLYLNGTLEEHFVYKIETPDRYRMLFHAWKAPLSYEKLDIPYIEPVNISLLPGAVPYVKDSQGSVKIISSDVSSYEKTAADIGNLAELNEMGSYKPDKYGAGKYEITYILKLHPPLECDDEYCHLNLKLAEEHLPYKNLTIAIHDPAGLVVQIFPHHAMDARKERDAWVITGESPKDSLLEFEMLLKPSIKNVMAAFPEPVSDVKNKTLAANSDRVGTPDKPYVEFVSISSPPGTIPYAKGIQGITPSSSENIAFLVQPNEAGSYNPSGFDAGKYEISYVFKLHPLLECNREYCYLNLKLSEEHLPYRSLTITIHDPDGLAAQILAQPAMDARKEGDSWILTGHSPGNTPEVKMLFNSSILSVMDGFPRQVSDVKSKMLPAYSGYSGSEIIYGLNYALAVMVFLFPAILALIYYKYGREKFFTVPKFLSYVPDERKPWLVNLVFKNDPFDFDEDGFYATLLDLHRRKIIEIEEKEKEGENGLRIRLLTGHEQIEDNYERKVLDFLDKFSENNVFDTREFEDKLETLSDDSIKGKKAAIKELSDIGDSMSRLLKVSGKKVTEEFVLGGKSHVWKIIATFFILMILMLILFINQADVYPQLTFGLFASIILLFQSFPPLFFPSALFGKWKENYYKEKLEWDAFRTFLSDFALIKKYTPDDMKMWQEWLVFGTALGVGDKVSEAMKGFNINIPDIYAIDYMPEYFRDTYSRTSLPSPPTGSGGWEHGGSDHGRRDSGGHESGGQRGGFGEGHGFGGGKTGAR